MVGGPEPDAPVEIVDEHTEKVRLATARPPRNRLGILLFAAAAAASAAGGALWLADRGDRDLSSGARVFEAEATAIAMLIDTAARAVRMRADGLAASPLLRAAIGTDAATVRDVARDELHLDAIGAETIELHQLAQAGSALMLRLPDGAPAIDLPATADALRVQPDGSVVAIATAAIPQQGTGTAGSVVVSAPVDLTPIARRLDAREVHAVLTGLATPIALAAGHGNGRAQQVAFPIATSAAGSATLALVVDLVAAAPRLLTPRLVCWGIALLLLAASIATLLRRRG